MMKKIIPLLIALFLLTGCAPATRLSTPERGRPRPRLSTKLEVKVRPKNANVKVTRLPSENAVKVKIRVLTYGTDKHPGTGEILASSQVGVSLKRQGYMGLGLEIYSPARDVTATLIPFSADPDRIRNSFRAAAKTYSLPTAYPTYLPKGYRLVTAEYQDNIQGNSSPGSDPNLYLLWLRWAKGKSEFSMRFLSPNAVDFSGKPVPFERPVALSRGLSAKLVRGSNHAAFLKRGKELSWDAEGHGLTRREFMKIIRSIRLSPL